MGPPILAATVTLYSHTEAALTKRRHQSPASLGAPGGQGPQGLELLPPDCRRPVFEILAWTFPAKNVPRSELAGSGGVLCK